MHITRVKPLYYRTLKLCLVPLVLAACEGASPTSGGNATFSIGGDVSGLDGSLVIQNNASDTLVISSASDFKFTGKLAQQAHYAVQIFSAPQQQTCTLSNASGTVQSEDVTNIQIMCVDNIRSLSGTISVSTQTMVDSDVNNPDAPYASNDNVASAQILVNPVSLGGYASAQGTGLTRDRFGLSADYADYYGVTLNAGQSLTLTVSDYDAANPAATDLDLLLYNASGNTLIDSAEGTGATHNIIVNDSNTFIVMVSAVSGYSNYTLTIGSGATAASTLDLNLSSEFIPGEIIVQYHDQNISTATQKTSHIKSLGMELKSGRENRSMLFNMNTGQRKQLLTNLGVNQHVLKQIEHTAQSAVQAKRETMHAIKALRKRSDIRSADLNYVRKKFATPNDTQYNKQWHYSAINLPQAWNISTGSSAVIVAVIDTGVFMTHPDLTANLTNTGYDFISSTGISNDGNGIDNNPDDPGDSTILGQSSWHGTHVAGTIAASSNNDLGVAGVAWTTRIMPLRVLGAGGGSSYDVMQAVRYAAQLTNDSGTVPAQKADIMNLSLGGAGSSQMEQDTVTAARNAGVIIIAAAGNSNSNQLFYPASYTGVVSVSAVNYNSNKAYYSNYGSSVDIAAPGGDMRFDLNSDGLADGVLSTLVSDSSGTRQPTYGVYHGTSMAAPHVAGVAALMSAVRKNNGSTLTPAEFDALIASGNITTDIGISGRDDLYGYGLIDAFEAVQAVAETAPTSLQVNPDALNFGVVANNSPLEITVSKYGTGNISVSSITSNADWLTQSANSVDGSGLGTYHINVARNNLPYGIYTGTLTFNSASSSINLNVTVQLDAATSASGNAGTLYVALLDPVHHNTRHMVEVNADNGVYYYNFSNIPPGNYRTIASTDMDNDYTLCDTGEACGSYSGNAQSSGVMTVSEDISGIDFSVEFDAGINVLSTTNMTLGRSRLFEDNK
jgi:serine protease